MLAAKVEEALTPLKARAHITINAVAKFFFASPFSLSSTQNSELESSVDANVFRAFVRKLNHRGGQKTHSDSDSFVANADYMNHEGEQETTRKAAKGKAYKSVYADTERADYVLTDRASSFKTFFLIDTKTKRADHVSRRDAAGFEANRHSPLASVDIGSETAVDGASVTTASPQTAHHEDTAVYGMDAADLLPARSVADMLAERHSVTVCHAGLGGAHIADSVHATGQHETAQTAAMSFWLPPITVDGALYIRMVHELPDQPATDDDPVHIT